MSKKVKYIYIYHCDTISKLILSFLFSSFSCFSPLSFLLTPPPPHRPPLTPSTSPSSPSPLDSLSSRESWSSQRSTLICRLFSPLTVLHIYQRISRELHLLWHSLSGPRSTCPAAAFLPSAGQDWGSVWEEKLYLIFSFGPSLIAWVRCSSLPMGPAVSVANEPPPWSKKL